MRVEGGKVGVEGISSGKLTLYINAHDCLQDHMKKPCFREVAWNPHLDCADHWYHDASCLY